MFYVYSLKCKDGYYIDCTNDLIKRFDKHVCGYVKVTKNRRPLSVDFYLAFAQKHKAFAFEKYLKSGSGRSFTKRHS